MNKKILLIFASPVMKSMYVNTLPPLGLLGIASLLESKGFRCDVLDFNISQYNPDYTLYDAICFSVNISNLTNTAMMIKEARLKNPSAKIIVGGPFIESRGMNIFSHFNPDFVVIGEAEDTVLDILTKKEKLKVRGIITKNRKGEVRFTGKRELEFNLDKYPFPALNKVPIEKYNMSPKKIRPISSIVTSRGCPNKCIFCFHSEIWRQRSAKNVVDEIEWQVNRLGVKEIAILDDNFTLNRARVLEICDLIVSRNIRVRLQLNNGIRADKADYQLLKRLKEAGLWYLGVAPEVGDGDSLKKIRKDFVHRDVENLIKWCKKLSIVTIAFFTLGYPWENKKEIEKTIDYAIKLDTEMAQFSRVTPIEGTALYDMVSLQNNSMEDEGFFINRTKYNLNNLSAEELDSLIKKAYWKFYLRPHKAIDLLKSFRLQDIIILAKYGLITGNL